jgi:hypothetical protein
MERLPYPERVEWLGRRICELKEATTRDLGVFRAALREFAAGWYRETAKRVAVGQSAVTLGLGRHRIHDLKAEIEARILGLEEAIDREFSVDSALEAARAASSGQVAPVIARRFEDGIRHVLAGLGATLEKYGYARDEHWLDGAHRRPLELPPDLRDRMDQIAEAIAEQKVAEAKIAYYDRQHDREIAADLWENS